MPNENCLEGYRCPECKSDGPFLFTSMATMLWYDDGTEDVTHCQIMMDEPAQCPECGRGGTARDFLEATQK